MGRANSLEKTLMLGKIEGRKRRGQQGMRYLKASMDHWNIEGITDSMDMNLCKDWEGLGNLVCCSPWGCEELDMTLGLHKCNTCSLIHYLSFKSQTFFFFFGRWIMAWQKRKWMKVCLLLISFQQPSQLKSSFPGSALVKNLPANAAGARDMGLISGLRRSPGTGSGSPLQSSCLENPIDKGDWWAIVHGVTKSWTRLSY